MTMRTPLAVQTHLLALPLTAVQTFWLTYLLPAPLYGRVHGVLRRGDCLVLADSTHKVQEDAL
jgi:hypothetical protein